MRTLRERAEVVDELAQAPLREPSRAGYRRFLSDLYGFVAAFEAKFVATHDLDVDFVRPRMRTPRIANDLLALGLTSAEYPRLTRRCEVPDFLDPITGLGWLVGVERLTFGFESLRGRLYDTLAHELAIAGSFLRSCEGNVLERWRELAQVIEVWVDGEAGSRELAAAAHAALDCAQGWLTGDSTPPRVAVAAEACTA